MHVSRYQATDTAFQHPPNKSFRYNKYIAPRQSYREEFRYSYKVGRVLMAVLLRIPHQMVHRMRLHFCLCQKGSYSGKHAIRASSPRLRVPQRWETNSSVRFASKITTYIHSISMTALHDGQHDYTSSSLFPLSLAVWYNQAYQLPTVS